jgi:hypothetical protein
MEQQEIYYTTMLVLTLHAMYNSVCLMFGYDPLTLFLDEHITERFRFPVTLK